MNNKILLCAGIATSIILLSILIIPMFINENNNAVVTDGEVGTVKGTDDYGDEADVDTSAGAIERNNELRVVFLDEYLLASVIPPNCLPNTCGIMQQWLDKAFNNNSLNYTIILDKDSIKQTDMYAMFSFKVEEFPEYSFQYAHYYGSNEVLITSPQFEKQRFPRNE